MNTIKEWGQVVQNSFMEFWEKLVDVLPHIFGALILLIVGWGIAKVTAFVIKKILVSIKLDQLGEKLVETTSLDPGLLNVTPSQLISKFVYWAILLLFFISASDTLGWTMVSESINTLLNYLPQLFSSLVVFVVGLYIAGFVKQFLNTAFNSIGLAAGTVISKIVFYIILLIVATTALDQAGIDTSLITANITIILGGLLLAFAIAFGYSSREVFANIISSLYVRNNFKEGQKIQIGEDIAGIIKKIDAIHVTLQTEGDDILLPTQVLISKKVNRAPIEPD
ncbi:MAG: hypothetical protein FH748_04225 [Balneolaceae bacterium]|nr:hypothetical protein [Balneolaceae bacterium]